MSIYTCILHVKDQLNFSEKTAFHILSSPPEPLDHCQQYLALKPHWVMDYHVSSMKGYAILQDTVRMRDELGTHATV